MSKLRAEPGHRSLFASIMRNALEDFQIVECEPCDGSGLEPGTDEDACHDCGGYGELIRGGDPVHLRAAMLAVGVKP